MISNKTGEMPDKDPEWVKYSLAKMKKAGLTLLTAEQILGIMSGLLVWISRCVLLSSKKNRAEFVLGLLGEKQAELSVAKERATSALDAATETGIGEMDGKLFPKISEAADARVAKLMGTEYQIARELDLIAKAMIEVTKALEGKGVMEPPDPSEEL